MKRLLFAAVAIAALGIAAPAGAQVGAGVGPGGAGVQVGPVGAGVGPAYGSRRTVGVGPGCRTVRERIITPSGRKIIRTRRVCG